jgi:hypothetical protein
LFKIITRPWFLFESGGDVTLTDLEIQIKLLQKNVETNKGLKVRAKIYAWWSSHLLQLAVFVDQVFLMNNRGEEPDNDIKGPFDTIIASECIYTESLVEPLIRSLRMLSDEKTEIFVSYEIHNPESVNAFLQLAAVYFDLKPVESEQNFLSQ